MSIRLLHALSISGSEFGHILGLHIRKIGMLQGLLHGDSLGRVKCQHLHAQIQGGLIEVLEVSLRIDGSELGEGVLEIRQFVDIGPFVGSGGAVELEDLENLIDFGVAVEHSLLLDHLGEDAADSPNIHSETILFLPEEDFWRPVPQSFNFVGEGFDGDPEGPGESKVSNFEVALLVYKEILGLEVAVDDPAGMAVVEAVDDLVHEHLDIVGSHGVLVFGQVLLQVVVHIFKHQLKLLFRRNIDHFPEPSQNQRVLDDIGVRLQLLEDGDFSHGGGGNSFVLVLKLDLLDGHDFLLDEVLSLEDDSVGALPDPLYPLVPFLLVVAHFKFSTDQFKYINTALPTSSTVAGRPHPALAGHLLPDLLGQSFHGFLHLFEHRTRLLSGLLMQQFQHGHLMPDQIVAPLHVGEPHHQYLVHAPHIVGRLAQCFLEFRLVAQAAPVVLVHDLQEKFVSALRARSGYLFEAADEDGLAVVLVDPPAHRLDAFQ